METTVFRFGLVAIGALCWRSGTDIWGSGTATIHAWSLWLMLISYLVGFALMVAATIRGVSYRVHWLGLAGIVVVFLTMLQVHVIRELENGVVFTTDARMYMDYAARLLEAGRNPYDHDLAAAYRANQAPFFFATPLTDGGLTGRMAYPALSALVFVPFHALGINEQWVYPVFMVLALGVIYFRSKLELRTLILVPLFADPNHVNYGFGGVTDWVWTFFLCMSIATWHKPKHRAIWFGLACAFKHQPWVLAPFLLIRVWREADGDRKAQIQAAKQLVLLTSATFFIVNLPFIIWDPGAWFAGVMEPMRANMITYGQGLSALTMYGVVVIPKALYSTFMVAVIGLSFWVYWAHYGKLRELVWLLPGIILWFSNRSLTSYWYFCLGPLLLALFRATPMPGAAPSIANWRPTLRAAAGVAALIIGGVIWSATRPPAFDLNVKYPIDTMGAFVHSMDVEVTNNTDRRIKPRFATQTTGMQPFFWEIRGGPGSLEPGETREFRIASSLPFAHFDVRRGARLTVSDADVYHNRTAAEIDWEPHYVYADVIPNGTFRYWERGRERPTFWSIKSEPLASGKVEVRRGEEGEPESVISLLSPDAGDVERPWLRVDTYISLPEHDVEMWVKLPEQANLLPEPEFVYGLRLVVDRQVAYILYGDEETSGELPDGSPFKMFQAPRETWHQQHFNMRSLLADLGLRLEAHREMIPRFAHLDLPVVPTYIQLTVEGGRKRGKFGPIQNVALRPDVDALFRDDLEHPEYLAYWRGSYALVGRNPDQARADFLHATQLAPESGRAWFLLAETEFWRGDWRAAISAYEKAISRGFRPGNAYKGIGWCHFSDGRPNDAEAAWARAMFYFRKADLEEDSVHVADTLKGLGLVSIEKGNCKQAREQLTAAAFIHPDLHVDAKGLVSKCVPGGKRR
jgi:uncharacterized membrane protein